MTLKIIVDTKNDKFKKISDLMAELSKFEESLCSYEIKSYGYLISVRKTNQSESLKSINVILAKLMELAEEYTLE